MKRAYVTLVMCGETYVQGALVLARSLQASGSDADRVVMVDAEVGPEARNVLGKLFTVVHEVEGVAVEVQQRHQPRFSNTHYIKEGPSSWLRKIFTKFHMFGLMEYDMICWLDADMYALSCPDSLFSLKAPAGVCSYYSWEQDNDLHGHPVPREDVERSLTVPTSSQKPGDNVNMPYGIRGAVSLLEPCEETRARVFADLDGMEEYGNRNLVVGPDEMYLTRMYIDSWTHIHHKFACPAWKTEEFTQRTGEDPVLLHFVTDKPWGSKNWPDFDQWRATARGLMEELPECAKFFSASVRGNHSHSRASAAGSVPKPSQSGAAGASSAWRPRWKQEGRAGDDQVRGGAAGRVRGGHHPGAPWQGRHMSGRHQEQGPRDNRRSSRDHGGHGPGRAGMGHPPPGRADADRW